MTKHWTVLIAVSLAALLAFFAPTPLARADIFQWEYINPDDPSQGKQPSTTLAPDGAGVNAAPGADLTLRDLTMAYLTGADLTGAHAFSANLAQAELRQANLTQANLTNADLGGATITGASLIRAEVRGATFSGITKDQLYSTSSYQAHDLTGIRLYGHDLAGVNLAGRNLTNASLQFAGLENADFSQANLTGATVWAGLTGANFTGAAIRGANLSGITPSQLYATASYQEHDLSGIWIYGDLPGVNLDGQKLTNARFENASLDNANFSEATLTNAVFWFATPNGANFRQANLANATFRYSDLTGADLTGADIHGASFLRDESGNTFVSTGLTAAQLYSTASYQSHDLTGINLQLNELSGVNLAGQNLANAGFSGAALVNADFSGANLSNADFSAPPTFFYGYTDLTGANLSQANLTNARFNGRFNGYEWIPAADLTGADLSGSDTRGTEFSFTFAWTAPITTNQIDPYGHIAGLDLTSGATLIVRDYDGDPAASPPNVPLPIVVEQHLAMDATGTLRLVFETDPWDSTISFASGIPVALGGTLELAFAADVDIATQSGRTIDLFDWSGVTPTGAFTVSSPYAWDLAQLYTTGEVTLAAAPGLPGDFNNDGTVDAADYIVWRKTGGTQEGYNTWRANFGRTAGSGSGATAGLPSSAVPEPASFTLLLLASCGCFVLPRHRAVAKNRG